MKKMIILLLLTMSGCFTANIPEFDHLPIAPPVNKPVTEKTSDLIRYHTAYINYYADLDNKNYELKKKMELLKENNEEVNSISYIVEDNEEALKKQIEEMKTSEERSTKKIWVYVIAISALMILSGSFMSFLVSPKIGISLALSGIVTYVVAYTMLSYAWLFAVVGAVIILISLILVTISAIKEKQALVEIVQSFEVVKKKDFDEVKEEIKNIQSSETKEIVSNIKNKIGI